MELMVSATSEHDGRLARWQVGLDSHQAAAVAAPPGALAILAGPGSGKTRTLVARIGLMGELVGAGNIGAFSHTTKAAGEMRERVGRLRLGTCSTIHAAAWRLLRDQWDAFGALGQLQPNIWVLVKDAANTVLGNVATETIGDLVNEIDCARAVGLDADRWTRSVSGRDLGLPRGQVQDIWREFNSNKARGNWWDFADVLERATVMARENVGGWQAIFVDEYQDIDPVQEQLVRLWARGGNITVVGDSDQAIFGFKGGDARFLTDFTATWPGAAVVQLVNNYRSTDHIVSWTNRLSTARAAPLISVRGSGESATVYSASDEEDEERAIVSGLRRWHQSGISWSEMAVLFRYNAISARVEAALAAAGIPYRVEKGEKFFDRADIRRVLIPFGELARARPHVNGPDMLRACAQNAGYDLGVEPPGAGARRESWEAVRALVELVADTALPAGELLGELLTRAKQAHCLTPGGVTLSTIHAAKGLEWDAVWVAGMVEGVMPSAYAQTPRSQAEEQHLAYVAISRAKSHLTVSWARKRHNGWNNIASRYLDLMMGPDRLARRRAASSAVTAVAAAGASVAVCGSCREPLRGAAARKSRVCSVKCLDTPSRDLYDRLVTWRQHTASELNVDVADVASDRALFSIAATRSDEFAGTVTCGSVPMPSLVEQHHGSGHTR